MPAAESDERAGSKDGSDNGCIISTPNTGKADPGNINSEPSRRYQETNSTSSPAPREPAPTTAGAAATPTRVEEAGPTKPADLLKTAAERAEFGSSPVVAYSGTCSFGRGYDHRRRGGGEYRQSTFLPPPPPQAPGVGGGASWTGLRDLDGYTSSAEADIESMASVASHDSREVRERESRTSTTPFAAFSAAGGCM